VSRRRIMGATEIAAEFGDEPYSVT